VCNYLFKSLLIIITALVSVNYDSKIQAQITPDESLGEESSVVTPDVEVKGQTADRIDGGTIRDRNLFHSFSQFNVGESESVYFANPDNIDQIFTRVTGEDPSNILGTLGVDGAADLLLLNPNGIIFGENSSLDVEGSFFGTTADSVVFEDDTEFSAVNPQSPLLTVGVPLGLQVGSNPGSIIVRSPLAVNNGQNLSFLGGKLEFQGTGTIEVNGINGPQDLIFAPGGKVELGGLSAAGVVTIEKNGNLSFPENIARSDVSFNNFRVDVRAGGGGLIRINAGNLELLNGQLDSGINPFVELTSGQAGDIIINATDKVSLGSSNNGESQITNVTGDISAFTNQEQSQVINTQGNGGNIEITTGILEGTGSFSINSLTNGSGNSGNVKITATEAVNLFSASEIVPGNYGGIFNSVESLGTGNGGNIEINTPVLNLSRSFISTTTNGEGDAGNITINATDTVSIRQASQLTADTFGSGNSGNLTITAPTADITIDGQETFVTTETLLPEETNSSDYANSVVNKQKGGNLTIQGRNVAATNGASVSTRTEREEDAGDLTINTQKLTIAEGAVIQAATSSSGNSGNISVEADEIIIANNSKEDLATGISAITRGSGDGGTINISTNKLDIQDLVKFVNVGIAVGSLADGNAGEVLAQVHDSLKIDNGFISSFSDRSSGGEISISAGSIWLRGNSEISSRAFSDAGGGGNLTLSADSIVAFDDSDILASSSDGVGGNITLDTDAFFSNNFNPAFLNADPEFLDKNNRVDINASGAINGNIDIPNVNFLPNNLIKLSEEIINTDEVVANSCVIRNQQQGGTFIVSGNGGLTLRPSDPAMSAYSTGDVRPLPQQSTAASNQDSWNPNEPIVEPEGMYRLSNGQLVLSRQCN
jgi:filamentous hemagglutinin family protein